MPTAARGIPRKPRRPHVIVPDDNFTAVDPTAVSRFVDEELVVPPAAAPAIAADGFDPFLEEKDGGLPFMDAVAQIEGGEWQKLSLYCYRLDPKVRNAPEENSYIGKYSGPMGEEDIQAEHGGGKYMLILKEMLKRGMRSRERSYRFRIDGPARLRPGQTLMDGNNGQSVVMPAGGDDSQGTALAKALPELAKILSANKGQAGMSEALEMMSQAHKTSLSIVAESTRQNVTAATGSPLGDRLLDMLLAQRTAVTAPARSPIEEKLIEIALARLEHPEPAADRLSQLGDLKELLGVENIFDLVKGANAGGDVWKSDLVKLGASLVSVLPTLMHAYISAQERAAQRAMAIQAPIPAMQAAPGQIAPFAAPPTPGPVAVEPLPVEPGTEDPAMLALNDIVFCYDASLSGPATASFIARKYPTFLPTVKTLLEDRQQVMFFAQNTPPLNAIAGEPEFKDFLEDFIQEILNPEEEEPAGA